MDIQELRSTLKGRFYLSMGVFLISFVGSILVLNAPLSIATFFGIIMAGICFYYLNPKVRQRLRERDYRERDMRDQRDLARNRAIGEEEGRIKARTSHQHKQTAHSQNVKWANQFRHDMRKGRL